MSKPAKSSAETALWAGVLAVIDALPKETGGTARHVGQFVVDGASTTATTTFEVDQPDGTTKVYALTLAVEQSVDEHDRTWGPGGRAAGSSPDRRVVVDANLYLIGDGARFGGFRGFGGREFCIEFFDGRKVATRDLWHQGVIPPKWRELWPDNARFVNAEAAS